MKKNIVLNVILCMGFVFMNAPFAQATMREKAPSVHSKVDVPDWFERIYLHGDLMLNVGPNAIEAGASDNAVYIQFNQSFGSVNIAILNGNGVQVYGTVVDTSIQQVFIIPFSNVSSDTYTVVLNKADNYAEGDFERE